MLILFFMKDFVFIFSKVYGWLESLELLETTQSVCLIQRASINECVVQGFLFSDLE